MCGIWKNELESVNGSSEAHWALQTGGQIGKAGPLVLRAGFMVQQHTQTLTRRKSKMSEKHRPFLMAIATCTKLAPVAKQG